MLIITATCCCMLLPKLNVFFTLFQLQRVESAKAMREKWTLTSTAEGIMVSGIHRPVWFIASWDITFACKFVCFGAQKAVILEAVTISKFLTPATKLVYADLTPLFQPLLSVTNSYFLLDNKIPSGMHKAIQSHLLIKPRGMQPERAVVAFVSGGEGGPIPLWLPVLPLLSLITLDVTCLSEGF